MGKTEGQKLEEKLCFKPKHIAKDHPKEIEKAIEFAEGYKTFLDHSNGGKSGIQAVWTRDKGKERR